MLKSMITSTFYLPGHDVTKNIGLVRGITARSRSIVGNFFDMLQSLFGGNITIYTNLCEQAPHRGLRPDVRSCPAAGGQRHRRCTLRRYRSHGGSYGSAVLWHSGRRVTKADLRPGIGKRPRWMTVCNRSGDGLN
jgi:hypothetical protein